jgi:hypothetical protein
MWYRWSVTNKSVFDAVYTFLPINQVSSRIWPILDMEEDFINSSGNLKTILSYFSQR